MGTYSSLYIGDYELLQEKSCVDYTWLRIFREGDRRIEKIQDPDYPDTFEFPQDSSFEYVCTVKMAKERLNILGFSMQIIQKHFQQYKDDIIQGLIDQEGSWREEDIHAEIDLIRTACLDDWANGFAYLVNHNIHYWKKENLPFDAPKLVHYMLVDHYDDRGMFGFPIPEFNAFLRIFIERLNDDTEITINYTELVHGGYISEHDELCDDFDYDNWESSTSNSKIIIMTEGSVDSEFIQILFELLMPNIHDFYSFLDFNSSKANGGTSYLVSNIKAFAAAGVANKIIAIFDNDAAGFEGMKQLEKVKIPDHIKILKYPDIEMAKNYPTIGPTGMQNLDINGLACSIELYLGTDVLKENDVLLPVQWRGYRDSVDRYQGEISKKGLIQEKFRSKFKSIAYGKSKVEDYDWTESRALLAHISQAFAE